MTSSTLMRCGFIVSAALAMANCGKQSNLTHSSVKGHYEQYSDAELLARKDQQAIVAEYAPQQSVIISSEAMSFDGFKQLIRGFFESKLNTVYLMIPANSKLSSSQENAIEVAAGINKDKVKAVSQTEGSRLTVWARDWSPRGMTTFSG